MSFEGPVAYFKQEAIYDIRKTEQVGVDPTDDPSFRGELHSATNSTFRTRLH